MNNYKKQKSIFYFYQFFNFFRIDEIIARKHYDEMIEKRKENSQRNLNKLINESRYWWKIDEDIDSVFYNVI